MGEEDNQVLGVEDLSREEKLKELQVRIMDKVNDMQEKNIPKDVLEGHLSIRRAEDGSGNFELWIEEIDDIPGLQAKIPATKLATISDNEIMYIPENIKQYEEFYKVYDIEDKIPNEYKDIKTLAKLKEREGKAKEHEAGEQEREPREEENDEKEPEEEEVNEEEQEEQKEEKNDERPKTRTELPDNAIKITSERMADPNKTVKEELDDATGKNAEEYYVASVGTSNNVENKLFAKKHDENGQEIFEEVELDTPGGTNPTDKVTIINEKGELEGKTADTILTIKERGVNGERNMYVQGGPYGNIAVGNKINGEHVAANIENRSKQGEKGYADSFTREIVGDTTDARIGVQEIKDVHETMNELETKGGMANDMNPAKDGISTHEAKAGLEALKEDLKKRYIAKLKEENPGRRDYDIKAVADKMVEIMIGNDKGVEVDEKTAQELAEQEYADEQKQPGDPRPGSIW